MLSSIKNYIYIVDCNVGPYSQTNLNISNGDNVYIYYYKDSYNNFTSKL